MRTAELRRRYLDFFTARGHTLVSSDTLVPADTSLLFTSAGMNQFKPYFLGEKKDIKRATSCQKCLRTGDLEKVGRTAYHHTFFEMLGNFSFGDYFKKEAIVFAWEFLTKELSIPKENLWVSVYADDDEAYAIWKDYVNVPQQKIVKLGAESNFWPANAPAQGPNGPCGPCSEIFFDRGSDTGCRKSSCNPDCSCGRFVEVWNLVFTQFNRIGQDQLEPLPQKNIDTGMGLERMACVLQAKTSNFEIDILEQPVEHVRSYLGVKDEGVEATSQINAIVDHTRAAIFAIADGIYPSNEERGYVIRKLIRRADWKAHFLSGQSKAFLYECIPVYVDMMKDFYPEIEKKQDIISKVISEEENRFFKTLKEGRDTVIVKVNECKKNNKKTIDAPTLFRFYDTYGFPLELTKEVAHNNGLGVDEKGFDALLEKHREQSRTNSMFDENIFSSKELHLDEKTKFCGYEAQELSTQIIRIFSGGKEVEKLQQGQQGAILLEETPFYPESGGQLTDKGTISVGAAVFEVGKVIKIDEAIVHQGKVISGMFTKSAVKAVIDTKRRQALARAHTATHLLQAALRQVLGAHVTQQGSLVDEDRFRFDFTHFQALTPDEIASIEEAVAGYILSADAVSKEKLSLSDAQKQRALAFFKDKYESEVRVVSVGGYSKELCGGTHLDSTSEVGAFVIESESSISSGIRRIEAIVGQKAYDYVRHIRQRQAQLSKELKVNPEEVPAAVSSLRLQMKQLKAMLDRQNKELLGYKIDEIRNQKKKINGCPFIGYNVPGKDYGALLFVSDELRKKEKSLFLFLVSAADKNIFVCAATADLVKKGFGCKAFLHRFSSVLGLRGGGKELSAQGVVEKLDKGFLKKAESCFKEFTQ